jgi:uncharacterized membrane protein
MKFKNLKEYYEGQGYQCTNEERAQAEIDKLNKMMTELVTYSSSWSFGVMKEALKAIEDQRKEISCYFERTPRGVWDDFL